MYDRFTKRSSSKGTSGPTELILTEKPQQAIALVHYLTGKKPTRSQPYYLTDKAIVVPLQGHCLEFKEPDEIEEDKWGGSWANTQFPILPAYPIPLKLNKRSGGRIKTLKDQLRGFKGAVVIAADMDREGERLAHEALEYCKSKQVRLRMKVGTEVSAEAYSHVFNDRVPADNMLPMVIASTTRATIDYWWGFGPTRAATLTFKPFGEKGALSQGRVQSVTLALVVRREREIDNFVPQSYYDLTVDVRTKDGLEIRLNHCPDANDDPAKDARIYDRSHAETILQSAEDYRGVLNMDKTLKRRRPPQLFDINELQRTCAVRWKWTADKTLEVADSVRLKGPITYCRGEGRYLEDNMAPSAPALMQGLTLDRTYEGFSEYSRAPQIRRDSVYNSKKLDGSHHAIIPSISYMESCGGKFDLSCLTDDEAKVFDIVARRYIANHLPDYEYEQTKIYLIVPCTKTGKSYDFSVLGNVPVKLGWKQVDGDDFTDKDRQVELPALKDKTPAKVIDQEVLARRTKAPKYLDEASLLGLLKTLKIGTGATRDQIIKTLRERNYISGSSAKIRATSWGHGIVEANEYVKEASRCLVNPEYTAELEDTLKSIERASTGLDAQKQANILLSRVSEDVKAVTFALLDANAIPQQIMARFSASANGVQTKTTSTGKRTTGKRAKPVQKPSDAQINLASRIAKKRKLKLTPEVRASARACSEFISQYKSW